MNFTPETLNCGTPVCTTPTSPAPSPGPVAPHLVAAAPHVAHALAFTGGDIVSIGIVGTLIFVLGLGIRFAKPRTTND